MQTSNDSSKSIQALTCSQLSAAVGKEITNDGLNRFRQALFTELGRHGGNLAGRRYTGGRTVKGEFRFNRADKYHVVTTPTLPLNGLALCNAILRASKVEADEDGVKEIVSVKADATLAQWIVAKFGNAPAPAPAKAKATVQTAKAKAKAKATVQTAKATKPAARVSKIVIPEVTAKDIADTISGANGVKAAMRKLGLPVPA